MIGDRRRHRRPFLDDAAHALSFPVKALDRDPGHDGGASLLGLVREPGVRSRPQHREGLVRGFLPRLVLEVEGDLASLREEPEALADDVPLERHLLAPAGQDSVEVPPPEHAPREVLGSRLGSAFDQQRIRAALGEADRARRPGHSRAYHDHVEVVRHRLRPLRKRPR